MKRVWILILLAAPALAQTQNVYSTFTVTDSTKSCVLQYFRIQRGAPLFITEFRYANGRVSSPERSEVIFTDLNNLMNNISDLMLIIDKVKERGWAQESRRTKEYESIVRIHENRVDWRLTLNGTETHVRYNNDNGRYRVFARHALDYSFADFEFYVEQYLLLRSRIQFFKG